MSADRWGVRITFIEGGVPVYDVLGPFDRPLAELVISDMTWGVWRGGRWVHVERAIVEPWLG